MDLAHRMGCAGHSVGAVQDSQSPIASDVFGSLSSSSGTGYPSHAGQEIALGIIWVLGSVSILSGLTSPYMLDLILKTYGGDKQWGEKLTCPHLPDGSRLLSSWA